MKIILIAIMIFLSGCATTKPYFYPDISQRISKLRSKAITENWLWMDWTVKAMEELELCLNEWAKHNLKYIKTMHKVEDK